MVREHIEEYLGAIFRLRQDRETPLPLSQLQAYFGYSPISIHEMIQKLATQGLVNYVPYRGVLLTETGEPVGMDLVRRHRLWERFLVDWLEVPSDEAHEIAGQLEHAAPHQITERLARILGYPEQCPHGRAIPPLPEIRLGTPLVDLPVGYIGEVISIAPELPAALRQLQEWGIHLKCRLQIIGREDAQIQVELDGSRQIALPPAVARVLWMN